MPLSYDTLALLLQKHAPGDAIAPAFFSDLFSILDPRRGGSVVASRVGPLGALGASIPFTVPRTGIYFIHASMFAFAGAVGNWALFVDSASGQSLTRHDVVSTSAGFEFKRIMFLEAGDIIQWNNVTALAGGDTAIGTIENFELALG